MNEWPQMTERIIKIVKFKLLVYLVRSLNILHLNIQKRNKKLQINPCNRHHNMLMLHNLQINTIIVVLTLPETF